MAHRVSHVRNHGSDLPSTIFGRNPCSVCARGDTANVREHTQISAELRSSLSSRLAGGPLAARRPVAAAEVLSPFAAREIAAGFGARGGSPNGGIQTPPLDPSDAAAVVVLRGEREPVGSKTRITIGSRGQRGSDFSATLNVEYSGRGVEGDRGQQAAVAAEDERLGPRSRSDQRRAI